MADKKKTPILLIIQWVGGLLAFAGLFTGLIGGSMAWGEWKAEQKSIQDERMFKSSDQRVKTSTHINAPYSKYKMLMLRDTIIINQKHIDTVQKTLGQAFDTINKFWIADAEDKVHRMKSRDRRDSLDVIQTQQMQEFGKELDIQKGINLQILDELKEIRKHHDST